MNYIKELNAFYDWLELNELSPSAINLWYALMHINNKAGWAETFTVAESVLCVKTKLTDRTLRKVRNELKQKGRIDFITRKGKPPIYRIIPFEPEQSPEKISVPIQRSENISADSSAPSSAVGSEVSSEPSSGISSTLNKHKQNETNKSAATTTRVNCFDTYNLCFGSFPSALQIEEIMAFMEQDGISEEAICHAFKKAATIGANYSYARSILNNWAKKGIRTMADVEREEEEFRKKRKNHNQSGRPVRKEAIPEWFDQWQPVESNDEKIENFEEEKRKLEAELKQFGS